MNFTAIKLAKRFMGAKEIQGDKDNPFIVWCLSTCNLDTHDETPWCSAFVNAICYLIGDDVPRTNSAWARSWLNVGDVISLEDANVGWDICVFQRGTGSQGHVGFYAGEHEGKIVILGGNQSDSVNLLTFDKSKLLGVRRLWVE